MVKILIEERFGRHVLTGNLNGDFFRYEVEDVDGKRYVHHDTLHSPLTEDKVLEILQVLDL
jgi:hypothetical protein